MNRRGLLGAILAAAAAPAFVRAGSLMVPAPIKAPGIFGLAVGDVFYIVVDGVRIKHRCTEVATGPTSERIALTWLEGDGFAAKGE